MEEQIMFDKPNIGILGLGHVGLPTALGLADIGWNVIGADDMGSKAQDIAAGNAPFYEPGLSEMLTKNINSGRFSVATSVEEAIDASDVIFVCVGTPQNDDGSADLSQIESAGRTIAQNSNSNKLVVEKSTTPVSTSLRIKDTLKKYAKKNVDFEVAVNPEFLREGTGLYDFFNPDRIVLGVESEAAKNTLLKIYLPLLEQNLPEDISDQAIFNAHGNDKFVITDVNTAELIKHASNSFLATKISFINVVADICEKSGSDVSKVAKGMGLDPRIGSSFLQAGLGFGGYCLPKDIKAFTRIGEDLGVDMSFFREVDNVNMKRVDQIMDKLRRKLWVLRDKTVAVWGIAFKPGTDDIRESPAIALIEKLIEEKVKLNLHDPKAIEEFKKTSLSEYKNIEYFTGSVESSINADAIIIATDWPEFKSVDYKYIKDNMQYPFILDARNLLNPDEMVDIGFDYIGVGRYS
ncbi:MAG: UDP-glucose dehydrogenase family protein [Dehalococcoidia bacterium]